MSNKSLASSGSDMTWHAAQPLAAGTQTARAPAPQTYILAPCAMPTYQQVCQPGSARPPERDDVDAVHLGVGGKLGVDVEEHLGEGWERMQSVSMHGTCCICSLWQWLPSVVD